MIPVSYLLSVTTSQKMDAKVILAILNIAGKGYSLQGFSDGHTSTSLWIISKSKRNKQEVITQLQAISGIHNVSIVALSNPVNKKELADVRELFAQIGWDASGVNDDALSLFINAKLQHQYTYYIDYDPREKKPIKIHIKKIEELPGFSPDWLKSIDHFKDDIEDKELTIDDIEIRSIVIETEEDEIEPKPPPPKQ